MLHEYLEELEPDKQSGPAAKPSPRPTKDSAKKRAVDEEPQGATASLATSTEGHKPRKIQARASASCHKGSSQPSAFNVIGISGKDTQSNTEEASGDEARRDRGSFSDRDLVGSLGKETQSGTESLGDTESLSDHESLSDRKSESDHHESLSDRKLESDHHESLSDHKSESDHHQPLSDPKSESDHQPLGDHESHHDVDGTPQNRSHSGTKEWWWKTLDDQGNLVVEHYQVEKLLLLDPPRQNFRSSSGPPLTSLPSLKDGDTPYDDEPRLDSESVSALSGAASLDDRESPSDNKSQTRSLTHTEGE